LHSRLIDCLSRFEHGARSGKTTELFAEQKQKSEEQQEDENGKINRAVHTWGFDSDIVIERHSLNRATHETDGVGGRRKSDEQGSEESKPKRSNPFWPEKPRRKRSFVSKMRRISQKLSLRRAAQTSDLLSPFHTLS